MEIGDTVGGRYVLQVRFDEGGQGEVWRAVDRRLSRTVVLKRALLDGERGRRQARREARILADMQHPNVVILYDVEEDPGGNGAAPGKGTDSWLVMEYVESRSLATVLRGAPGNRVPETDGVPAWRRAAHLGAQIAEALQAVHAKDVVHRDVKPGNILVTSDWTAKLGDFGASVVGDADDTIGRSGRYLFTPAYAAPEVHRGGRPTAAADVFSLGAALFAAVEGHSVYGSADDVSGVLDIRARAGELLEPERAGPLTPVLERLLTPLPEGRPDAAGARRLLEDVLVNRPAADPPPPPSAPSSAPPRRRAPRALRLALAAVAAAAVTGGLAWLGAALLDDEPPRDDGVGDPRSADPCALVSPKALADFGNARLDWDYGNFDRCDVVVTTDGSEVDVKVDLSNPPLPETRTGVTRDGTVGVVREAEEDGECTRILLLPDDNWITVSAQHWDDGSPDLCAMADAATDHAVGVLNDPGTIPRRPAPFPAGSLARYNACALPGAEALAAALPGVDAGAPETGFGDWSCMWHSTTDDGWADLRFDRAEPVTPEAGDPTQLAGHRAAVLPEAEGEGTCRMKLEYRTYTDADGQHAVESLLLVVGGADDAAGACASATALMEAAVRALPPL
ncbi:serine/threonine-protein kinase [Streptomyces litchfieldiae]|uniref:non-specific serine/threonine protein kinase n=1 Tax=Streptomyces litchfieldiae TaxID=3075543 RepID=A0ABU2MKK2_9ACTN|nr:serine/threonine-protein kinase [Streptomyces sp. DSM 44938]MDT0342131.1 serine/threonine-protein kinase [Streptomyces sp. DSM 44938]